MMTEQYKRDMRKFLQDLFALHTEFMFSPNNINNPDLDYSVQTNILSAPLYYKREFLDFFANEGLTITSMNEYMYKVSVVC